MVQIRTRSQKLSTYILHQTAWSLSEWYQIEYPIWKPSKVHSCLLIENTIRHNIDDENIWSAVTLIDIPLLTCDRSSTCCMYILCGLMWDRADVSSDALKRWRYGLHWITMINMAQMSCQIPQRPGSPTLPRTLNFSSLPVLTLIYPELYGLSECMTGSSYTRVIQMETHLYAYHHPFLGGIDVGR